MKIFYVENPFKKDSGGYGFYVHGTQTRDALRRAGVLVDRIQDADVALWVGTAHWFKYIPGIKNVLLTATEEYPHPAEWITDDVRRADLVLVPCEHNKGAFGKYLSRIEVVPEGIDPELFPFVPRKEPVRDEPFRFFYLGNINEFKGVDTLVESFRQWQREGTMPPNAELYIKGSNQSTQKGVEVPAGIRYETVGEDGAFHPSPSSELPRIAVDNRNVPFEELRALYGSAHCVVLPSTGEGWCLPLSEGMATGAPCIWTHWGGPRDYGDERVGFPLKMGTDFRLGRGWWMPNYDVAFVDPRALIRKMKYVYNHYPEALERGKRASERMHSAYTWDQSAERLVKVCSKWMQHVR